MNNNIETSENNKCFCVNCNKNTKYYVYDVPDLKGSFNGMRYIFKGKQARCAECDKMVFPKKIKDYNEKMFNEAIINGDFDF